MLKISKLTAHLKFQTPITLPHWMGNTFRGGFGVHLRKACCITKGICDDCTVFNDCIFYHTHMKNTSKIGYGAPPKPVVFIPPFFGKSMYLREDAFLKVDILLFGDFIKSIPYVVLGLTMLGESGIGSQRRYGIQKFEIEEITCSFSGNVVYDGKTLNIDAIQTIDMEKIPPLDVDNTVNVGFRTPFMQKSGDFPPPLPRLMEMIRRRLILYENEYGDNSMIAESACMANTIDSIRHFHNLKSRSQRSGKREFHTFTGKATYEISEINDTAKWMLAVGNLIGAGPKASYGLGSIQITPKLK